jgi:hypothetical protein
MITTATIVDSTALNTEGPMRSNAAMARSGPVPGRNNVVGREGGGIG